jgi:exopolysaccharide biosynthesis polyprenyl glycosylphosphotransferase
MRVFSEPHLFEGTLRGSGANVPPTRVNVESDPVADAVVNALGELPQPARRRGSLVEAASLVVSDLVALAISATLGIVIARAAGALSSADSTSSNVTRAVLTALAALSALVLHGAYRSDRQHLLPRAGSGTRAVVFGYPLTVLLLAAFCNVTQHHVSLSAVLLMTMPAVAIVPIGRHIAKRLPLPGRAQTTRVLIVGSGKVAKRVADRLSRVESLEVVGMADDDPGPGEEVLGPISDLAALVDRYRVDRILVAFSRTPGTSTLTSLRDLRGRVGISVVPRMFEMLTWRSSLEEIHGIPVLHVAPASLSLSARIVKRTLDLTISSLILLAISPILITAAIAIKATSPGPIFFRQPRWGRRGETFYIYKLRSMRMGSDGEAREEVDETNEVDGPLFKMKADPRITRVGAFLRRTSVDELPQLLNVLKGDMSLVGPRPFVPAEAAQIDGSAARRYEVLPGMTGLWQVSGRSELSYEDLRHLDTVYVSSWSLWWDLRILAHTPGAVFKRSGAY